MAEIIKTKIDLCMGCNKCVRKCPMGMANITYQDEEGNIKVKVDSDKCIQCGRCVSVCAHESRYYIDDTEIFFKDLAEGKPVSLIAAPSTLTSIPDYKRLFTLLKKLGVKHIYDVSLGADICIWAHVRYIEKYKPKSLITQPCPSIVTYCEKYRHDLVPSLSPVQSPMACTSIYMKKYMGIDDRIAAISPCIAKTNEFISTGLVQYNVTFTKLLAYLEENAFELPLEETGFDHLEGGLGALFPMPGGLKENIEFFLGNKLHITKAEGYNIYEKLDKYAETEEEILPEIFDVLNCLEGCSVGPASSRNKSIFEIEKTMNNRKKAITEKHKKEYFETLYENYDKEFQLTDFMREYHPVDIEFPDITDIDINMAFKMLDKYTEEEQNVDCGACGSDTCYGMAKKIAQGVNIPMNCMVRSIEAAQEEHELTISALDQFETIWSNVESGIAIVDAETFEIIDVNPAAVQLFGAPREEIVGHICHDVFCPAEKCPIMELGHKVERSERHFVKADGTIIPIIKSVSKIQLDGRLALLENFTDVSHIKESEDQKRALDVAEQANQAKSSFLANMSHEIRTPMNAIIGMTNIGMDTNELDRKNYCLRRIDEASKHLLGIINDILDMSKIEAGKFSLAKSEFNFEKTIENIVNIVKFRMDEKHQMLSFYLDEKIPRNLYGDEQRITQVLMNLIGNAIKFTPEKGSISISTQLLETEGDVCTIMCSVTDTGIGIRKEKLDGLFESFQQAESSTAVKYGGTGLGLSISRNIVELMGGRIWVESEFGKGSSFIFTIKVQRIDEELSNFEDTAVSGQEISFKGKTALLAEDVDINREIVLTVLEPTMLKIECAFNGLEALEMFEASPDKYDIIMMDVQMPELDGLETTRRIRALNTPKALLIPIIAMTASVFKEDVEKCINAGMNDHVGKPLDFDDVMRKLKQYLA